MMSLCETHVCVKRPRFIFYTKHTEDKIYIDGKHVQLSQIRSLIPALGSEGNGKLGFIYLEPLVARTTDGGDKMWKS